MNIPFTLAELGYKPDPTAPRRFVHADGHPFYPVQFEDDRDKTRGDCIRAIAESAYRQSAVNLANQQAVDDFKQIAEDLKNQPQDGAINRWDVLQILYRFAHWMKDRDDKEFISQVHGQISRIENLPLVIGKPYGVVISPTNVNPAKANCKLPPYESRPRFCGVCGLGPCAYQATPQPK